MVGKERGKKIDVFGCFLHLLMHYVYRMLGAVLFFLSWLVFPARTRHTNDGEQIFPPGSVHLKWKQSMDAVADNRSADNCYLSLSSPRLH